MNFIDKVLYILNGYLFKVFKQQAEREWEREKPHKRWNLFALFLELLGAKKRHIENMLICLKINIHFVIHLIYWFFYEISSSLLWKIDANTSLMFYPTTKNSILMGPSKASIFYWIFYFSFGSHKKDKWKALLAIYFFYLFFFWTNPSSIIHIKYLFLNRRYFLAVFFFGQIPEYSNIMKRIEQNFYDRAKICHEFSIRHSFKQKQHIFSNLKKKYHFWETSRQAVAGNKSYRMTNTIYFIYVAAFFYGCVIISY